MELSIYESLQSNWWPVVFSIVFGILTFIRTYVGGQECPCDDKITNKIVLITGASGGIGTQTAKELAKRGGTIILACRNLLKGRETLKKIKKSVQNANIILMKLDLANINSIKTFVTGLNDYPIIDILINNAGIMLHPYEITSDGFEMHFMTNYLGHFLLTHLLLPKLQKSENGRIINVAAQAYSSGFINLTDINLKNSGENNILKAFTQSKLALVLMARYMTTLFQGTKMTINAVDPGLTRNTNHMSRSPLKTSIPVRISVWPWMWLFLKTPQQASQTIIYLAVDSKLSNISGKYFSDCEQKELSDNCKDESIDEELYKLSCNLLKIQGFKK